MTHSREIERVLDNTIAEYKGDDRVQNALRDVRDALRHHPAGQDGTNARAAAPEMLAVLRRFTGAMEQRSYPELQGIACEAFAAIAKAEGRDA